MTVCRSCGVVDLGTQIRVVNEEERYFCASCNDEDSVEEVDELQWIEDMEDEQADFANELNKDYE